MTGAENGIKNNMTVGLFTLCKYIFLYKIVIELIYIFQVQPTYEYSGFIYAGISDKTILSYFFTFVLLVCTPRKFKGASNYLFLIMLLITIIPLQSYFWLADQSSVYAAAETASAMLTAVIIRFSVFKMDIIIENGKKILSLLFGLYIVMSIYVILDRGGLDFRALDFANVYDIRSEGSVGLLAGYAVTWCCRAFGPFYFAYWCFLKRYNMVLLCLIFQVFQYLSYARKEFLVSIILCAGVYFLLKKKFCFAKAVPSALIGALCIGSLFFLNGYRSLWGILPYRTLFIPAQIQYFYYDYFSVNNFLSFSGSTIGTLLGLDYKYSEPIGFVITRYFYGVDALSNSNTGIFSAAFSVYGIPYMLITGLMLGVLLVFVDSLSRKIPSIITVTGLSYSIITLNDSTLSTAFVTGGIFISLILLSLCNYQELNISDN